jgi:hypothetical protein
MKTPHSSSSGVTRSSPRSRAYAPYAAGTLLFLLTAYAIVNPPRIAATYLDFDAFYCGARTLTQGQDPYRYEPLHGCETRNLHAATPNAVVPVPLPPYAIAAFIPLSRLPYPNAQFVWWLLLIGSGVAIVWALAEVTSFPLTLLSAPILIGLLLPSLMVGSLALLPIALLCLCAVALQRESWASAAVLAGVASLEPHVALPVMLAVFIFIRPMRVPLALAGAAIVALSLAAGRENLNAEFLRAVLPAHAVSEIGNAEQYGLSAVLYAFGAGERAAATLANLQYAIFVLTGLWLVRAMRTQIPESVVFVPMALAVTGGPFIHVTQIGAAIPLALAIARRMPSLLAWAGLTIVAVAIPWQASIGFGGVLGALVLFAVLAYNRVPWIAAVALSAAAAVALQLLQIPELHRPAATAIASVAPNTLAEVPWRNLAAQFAPTPFSWYGHALIYAGLACIYWSAIRFTRTVARA